MKSILALLSLGFLSLAPCLAQTQVSAFANAAGAQQRRVTILLTLTDHSDNPLQSVAKDALSVVEDSQPGDLLDVRSANQLPLQLGLVLLSSNTNFSQQQAAAIELVRKVIRANLDRAFVVSAGGDKPWSNTRLDWQSDPADLEKTIRSLDRDTGLPDAFTYNLTEDNANQNRRLRIQRYSTGDTSVFDIIWNMLKSDPRPARRAVVIFRNAWAHSPGLGNTVQHLVDERHSRIIADAQRLWTAFYVVGVEEPTPPPAALSQTYAPTFTGAGGYNRVYDQEMEKLRDRAYNGGKNNLERLASETGGMTWWSARKNYPDAVNGITNHLNSQYAVSYAVHGIATPGAQHLLQIKANQSGTRVFVQRAYFTRESSTPPPQTARP